METAEKQHAKRIEQTLTSINKNLERIAKSLEMIPPLDDTMNAEEPAEERNTSKSGPLYARECLSDIFKP